MTWAVIVVRTLVGAMFVFSSVSWWLASHASSGRTETPAKFLDSLIEANFFLVVKTLEFSGGVMLLSGRMAPLGIVLVTPVAVNILLFEVLMKHEPGPGLALVPALGFLIYGYWPYFSRIFTVHARVGG